MATSVDHPSAVDNTPIRLLVSSVGNSTKLEWQVLPTDYVYQLMWLIEHQRQVAVRAQRLFFNATELRPQQTLGEVIPLDQRVEDVKISMRIKPGCSHDRGLVAVTATRTDSALAEVRIRVFSCLYDFPYDFPAGQDSEATVQTILDHVQDRVDYLVSRNALNSNQHLELVAPDIIRSGSLMCFKARFLKPEESIWKDDVNASSPVLISLPREFSQPKVKSAAKC